MASGKSSVGRSLAARWGVELRDSDALIVERLGCSISDYFATHGEAAFREVEREVGFPGGGRTDDGDRGHVHGSDTPWPDIPWPDTHGVSPGVHAATT